MSVARRRLAVASMQSRSRPPYICGHGRTKTQPTIEIGDRNYRDSVVCRLPLASPERDNSLGTPQARLRASASDKYVCVIIGVPDVLTNFSSPSHRRDFLVAARWVMAGQRSTHRNEVLVVPDGREISVDRACYHYSLPALVSSQPQFICASTVK